MKYLVKFVVITLFLIGSTYTYAEQKIVVLDLKYVLNNSKAGKGAQDYLKKTFSENAKKYDKMQQTLKKDEKDLLSQKTVLSEDVYKKKSIELRKKVNKWQSEKRASLDKLATQRAKSRETLIKKIEPIVDQYINENNISIVLDKKNMIGGLNKYDITKIIVEKLNKELPSIKLQ